MTPHLSFGVSLARLDNVVTGRVQLKTVWLASILHRSHLDILQRYNTAWLLVSRVLKIVQAVVIQNEPSTFPGLVASTLLQQPTLLVRIEERVHQIITIILRYFEWLGFY